MAKKKTTKKQEGWFRTEVDFENSFKWWFALQWQNGYLQLFSLFFTLFILQLFNFGTMMEWYKDAWSDSTAGGIMTSMGMLIPITGASIIAYKGFYQYFNDLKNGRSR
jgi:hypothetical protein